MLKGSKYLHILISLLVLLGLIMMPLTAQSKEKKDALHENIKSGEYRGAKTATHPDWFKESFLDLDEDVADATEANKRLVLYFWQPGCPYCNQLWEDNFSDKEIEDKFRQNFEIVSINMWGDREVISVAGNTFTEKAFSAALDIKYTPTLLFFNEKKKIIHRLNGYIPPKAFKLSLEFVSGKHEKDQSFGEYSSTQKKQLIEKAGISKDQLHNEDFFTKDKTDLKPDKFTKKYLAVFFEEKGCENCNLLHEKTLQDSNTRKLVKQFESVQFDRNADTPLTTPSGKKATAKQWSDTLNISYLPAMLFFDSNGKEVMRIDAQMRTFHVQSVFDYVLTGAYKTEKNFQRYISARADKIREKGIDVDIWAY